MSNGRNAGAAANGGAIYGLGIFGAPFDYLVEHPDVLRLATWAGLERPTAVAASEALAPTTRPTPGRRSG
jgi:Tetracyclin repressor-like, C-terminal domain